VDVAEILACRTLEGLGLAASALVVVAGDRNWEEPGRGAFAVHQNPEELGSLASLASLASVLAQVGGLGSAASEWVRVEELEMQAFAFVLAGEGVGLVGFGLQAIARVRAGLGTQA
jgi:hypothetical protein